MHWRQKASLAAAFALASVASACSIERSSNPLTPGPTPTSLTGRWGTDIAVQGFTGRMTWTLTQTGTTATGPVLVGLASGTVLLNGVLNGTLTGSSFAYTIVVNPGGIPNQPTCTGQLGGTMTVTMGAVSTMVGPMSVLASNCAIQMPGTSFTLTKP